MRMKKPLAIDKKTNNNPDSTNVIFIRSFFNEIQIRSKRFF